MSKRRVFISAAAIPLAFTACTDVPLAPDTDLQPQFASGGLGVVHIASGSGHLFLLDGTHRVFSFGAQEYDDRTSTGQFPLKVMRSLPAFGFLQAEVTCLSVAPFPNGNQAWIAGVIKRASNPANIGKGVWLEAE